MDNIILSLDSVLVLALDLRLPAAVLPSSDPGQVAHTCPAALRLRPYVMLQKCY